MNILEFGKWFFENQQEHIKTIGLSPSDFFGEQNDAVYESNLKTKLRNLQVKGNDATGWVQQNISASVWKIVEINKAMNLPLLLLETTFTSKWALQNIISDLFAVMGRLSFHSHSHNISVRTRVPVTCACHEIVLSEVHLSFSK